PDGRLLFLQPFVVAFSRRGRIVALMSYKTIVVHLDCGSRRGERLDLAVRFAEEFDSHLIGLFALDLYVGMPMAADAGSILVEAELQRREACMSEAESE